MICPFCMQTHKQALCPKTQKTIPRPYINFHEKKKPIFFIMTIGASGHGKTCYLSSLFYSFYHHFVTAWPNFSFLALNQNTLNKIQRDYVNILSQLKVPAKTPIMFPEPMMLKMQKVPLIKRSLFSKKLDESEAIFVFYDIGGGTFDLDKRIDENLPIISQLQTLLFLIDLPSMIKKGTQQERADAERKILHLLNTLFNAINKLNAVKKKNIIISFTKADLMVGKDVYGPLSDWLHDSYPDHLPNKKELPFYIQQLRLFSHIISDYVRETLPNVYNSLHNNFKEVYFSTFTALGHDPVGGKVEAVESLRIFDPLFFNLVDEGYL